LKKENITAGHLNDFFAKDFYVFKAFGELVKDLLFLLTVLPVLVLIPWRIRELLWAVPQHHFRVLKKF
jgi:hypothetical protein